MELVGLARGELRDYVCAQLNHFFPDRKGNVSESIGGALDDALDRLAPCVRLARIWPKDKFNYLHSNQYAVFLYFLANTLWRRGAEPAICGKLYALNKALNALECFYTLQLPDIFCICHSPGIVLAQATYANYLVLYQSCTVGRVDPDARPVLSEGVVMFPNSAIVGKCNIGPRTYLSQGNSIIDADTPGNCVVFSQAGKLVFRPPKRDFMAHFFRLEEA
jgi:serine O-acetyltransferase